MTPTPWGRLASASSTPVASLCAPIVVQRVLASPDIKLSTAKTLAPPALPRRACFFALQRAVLASPFCVFCQMPMPMRAAKRKLSGLVGRAPTAGSANAAGS